MKKFIYLIILITFVFISSANPFEDIPEAHWAYEAVNSLSDKEILTGLPEDIFDGSQKVTRYDFASMLSRVINRLEKTNGLKNLSSNDVNSLSNLFNEFQNELALIDVRYVYLKNEIESIKKDIDRKNPYPKINLTGESVLDYNNFLYNTLPEKSTYRGFRNFNYLNLHASPNSETGIYLTFFNDNTDWIGTAGADVPRNDLIKLGY
ncbi:MAG: S-layer homology domain-containing protein, partial [Candidatus Muiribacteriota bacterium]